MSRTAGVTRGERWGCLEGTGGQSLGPRLHVRLPESPGRGQGALARATGLVGADGSVGGEFGAHPPREGGASGLRWPGWLLGGPSVSTCYLGTSGGTIPVPGRGRLRPSRVWGHPARCVCWGGGDTRWPVCALGTTASLTTTSSPPCGFQALVLSLFRTPPLGMALSGSTPAPSWEEDECLDYYGMLSLHRVFEVVGGQLTECELELLAFLLDEAPGAPGGLARARSGLELLLELERRGQCDESDLRLLSQLLRVLARQDLLPHLARKRRRPGKVCMGACTTC